MYELNNIKKRLKRDVTLAVIVLAIICIVWILDKLFNIHIY